MSVKSKARQARRAKATRVPDRDRSRASTHSPDTDAEKRAAGAIMGSLLSAITFGALEPAPESRA